MNAHPTPGIPVLAVVGHPNKGKSSIVSALAHDARVAIGPEPGTTTRTARYPMAVDGRTLYVLADTPGFQRARRALAWMREHETDAAHRGEVVRAFLETHRGTAQFRDECELLEPILEGAGILYVVDGAKPYGPEYEPEMEILRWTGRPRLALVNPIGSATHVEAWRSALGQYFSAVRVFDAISADFSRHVELLRAFGQLDERWTRAFEVAATSLEADRRERHRLAATVVAELLADVVGLTIVEDLPAQAALGPARERLARTHLERLREREDAARRTVERVYDHAGLRRREPAFAALDPDLFSEETWVVWGLGRGQLALSAALGGAAVGGGVDLALGGASLLLGAALGAAAGASSAWLGAGQVARVRVAGLMPLGGRRLQVGPSANLNLPYVVLGRALLHARLVALRPHALREPLEVPTEPPGTAWLEQFAENDQRSLARCFAAMRRDGDDSRVVDRLAGLLAEAIARVDRSA